MKRTPTWAIFAGTVVLVGALIWAGGSLRSHEGVRVSSLETPAVGTAGHEAVPEPYDSPATLHDLETMTGAIDPHALVGEHVDFHVRVTEIANSRSFWVGTGDNRVLVVLGRDNRADAQRDLGEPSPNRIVPAEAGHTARVIGTIENIPYAETRYGWGPNDPRRRELKDQEVYIHAESVTPE